jgi:hypothetical protein
MNENKISYGLIRTDCPQCEDDEIEVYIQGEKTPFNIQVGTGSGYPYAIVNETGGEGKSFWSKPLTTSIQGVDCLARAKKALENILRERKR